MTCTEAALPMMSFLKSPRPEPAVLRPTMMAMADAGARLSHFFVTGLTPLFAVISAVFWSWIWGPAGLYAATPLTLYLTVARARGAIAAAIGALRDRWKQIRRRVGLGSSKDDAAGECVTFRQGFVPSHSERKGEPSATVRCRAEAPS
ncbi:MAG TPA: hypothetical protein VMQ45_08310 [Burkholderiaceae bacterium]|nr:hypothetical protein [Burkholderiaceae bacterium]